MSSASYASSTPHLTPPANRLGALRDLLRRQAILHNRPSTHQELCILLDHLLAQHRSGISTEAARVAEDLHIQGSDFTSVGCIGEGQYGKVHAVRFHLNGQVYAMKTIDKCTAARSTQSNLFTERRLHLAADTYAPPLIAAFHTSSALHLVVEYAPCGSLWDLMTHEGGASHTGRIDEAQALWWTKQMIPAIAWVHEHGYAHRDVKPHNFLLYPDCRLKITDFGSAAPLVQDQVPLEYCGLPVGTPDYIAPEILHHAESLFASGPEPQPYTSVVDWWSLGVVLFELVVGSPPFFADTIAETYDKIKRYDMTSLASSSREIAELVQSLLAPASQRQRPHPPTNARRPPPPHLVTPTAGVTMSSSPSISYGDLFDTTSSISHANAQIDGSPPCDRWTGWSYFPESDMPLTPATPKRPSEANAVPKSTLRRRPMTEDRAYMEMLQCVEASATYDAMSVERLEGWNKERQNKLEALVARVNGLQRVLGT